MVYRYKKGEAFPVGDLLKEGTYSVKTEDGFRILQDGDYVSGKDVFKVLSREEYQKEEGGTVQMDRDFCNAILEEFLAASKKQDVPLEVSRAQKEKFKDVNEFLGFGAVTPALAELQALTVDEQLLPKSVKDYFVNKLTSYLS
jgi:hypothetical protein